MTQDEFIASGQKIFGKVGWKGQLAKRLGRRRETIGRYAQGVAEVPPAIELAMRALESDVIAERTA